MSLQSAASRVLTLSAASRIAASRTCSAIAARKTHLELTAQEKRSTGIIPAVVAEITEVTPTCRQLSLEVDASAVSFKPGQWVDFFIPDDPVVGGYSITSTPDVLRATNRLELVVKKSEHPPAKWIHSNACSVGAQVDVSVGGSFYYDDDTSRSIESDSSGRKEVAANLPDSPERRVLLIAGGIGATPVASIFRHVFPQNPNDGNCTERFAPSLSGKEKRALRADGHLMKPTVQVGRMGVHDQLIQRILATSGLTKVKVGKDSPVSAKQVAVMLGSACGAAVVERKGSTLLLFREAGKSTAQKTTAFQPLANVNAKARVVLLHSASSADELVFRDEILDICKQNPDHAGCYHSVTNEVGGGDGDGGCDEHRGDNILHRGRLDATIIQSALDALRAPVFRFPPDADASTGTLAADPSSAISSRVEVYLCGPPPMTEDIAKVCDSLNVPSDDVHFEKWW